jgi:hypothetical protein
VPHASRSPPNTPCAPLLAVLSCRRLISLTSWTLQLCEGDATMAPAPQATPASAPVTASDGPATKAADTKAAPKDNSANLLGLLFPGFKSDAGEHSTGVRRDWPCWHDDVDTSPWLQDVPLSTDMSDRMHSPMVATRLQP